MAFQAVVAALCQTRKRPPALINYPPHPGWTGTVPADTFRWQPRARRHISAAHHGGHDAVTSVPGPGRRTLGQSRRWRAAVWTTGTACHPGDL